MLMYDAAKTIGGVLLFAGALKVASHLAGQFRIGSAPWESLIAGGAAMLFGMLMCLLGDIGRRVVRLEEQLNAGDQAGPDIQKENDTLG